MNLIPGITSIYEWQGVVEESTEVLMMIKVSAEEGQVNSNFNKLIDM